MTFDFASALTAPATIWILAGLVLLMLEFTVPGLILFFFGLGAILTGLICAAIDISLNTQLTCFLIASIAMLVLLRGKLKPVLAPSTESDDPDIEEFIGRRARVTEAIQPSKLGKVEFQGADWKAISDNTIEEGTEVIVTARNNLTLTVQTTTSHGG